MLTGKIISSLRDFLKIHILFSTNILSLTGQVQRDRILFAPKSYLLMQIIRRSSLVGIGFCSRPIDNLPSQIIRWVSPVGTGYW